MKTKKLEKPVLNFEEIRKKVLKAFYGKKFYDLSAKYKVTRSHKDQKIIWFKWNDKKGIYQRIPHKRKVKK